ncbi:MAG: flagellar biosynthetic protein FliR [Myxococcota bacterium]
MEPLPSSLVWLLLCVMRALGLVLTAPILSARTVPGTVRLCVGLMLALAMFTSATPGALDPATPLWVAAARDTALGALTGFCARMALEAAQVAGQLVAAAMGMSYGAMVSPGSGAESTAIGELLGMAALGVGVALGLHRELATWLVLSVQSHPPGGALDVRQEAAHALELSAHSLAMGIRLAFPMLTALTLAHIFLGLVGRTAAQLNLSSLGFSVTILCGGGVLYVTAPEIAAAAAHAAVAVVAR